MNDENENSFANSFQLPKEYIFNDNRILERSKSLIDFENKPLKQIKPENIDEASFAQENESSKAPYRYEDPIMREMDSNSRNVRSSFGSGYWVHQ